MRKRELDIGDRSDTFVQLTVGQTELRHRVRIDDCSLPDCVSYICVLGGRKFKRKRLVVFVNIVGTDRDTHKLGCLSREERDRPGGCGVILTSDRRTVQSSE